MQSGQPALPGEQVVAVHCHPGQAEAVKIGIPVIQPEPDGQAGRSGAQLRDRRPAAAGCGGGRLAARNAHRGDRGAYPAAPVVKAGTAPFPRRARARPRGAEGREGHLPVPQRDIEAERMPGTQRRGTGDDRQLAEVRAQRGPAVRRLRECVQAAQAADRPAADLRQGEHVTDEPLITHLYRGQQAVRGDQRGRVRRGGGFRRHPHQRGQEKLMHAELGCLQAADHLGVDLAGRHGAQLDGRQPMRGELSLRHHKSRCGIKVVEGLLIIGAVPARIRQSPDHVRHHRVIQCRQLIQR